MTDTRSDNVAGMWSLMVKPIPVGVRLRVLLVDGDRSRQEQLTGALSRHSRDSLAVDAVLTCEEARHHLASEPVDVIIIAEALADGSAEELLASSFVESLPVVILAEGEDGSRASRPWPQLRLVATDKAALEAVGAIAVGLAAHRAAGETTGRDETEKMDAIARLASHVSHDLNNMLTVVRGYADILLQSDPDEPIDREAVEEIRQAVQRACLYIADLQRFSKNRPDAARTHELVVLVDRVHARAADIVGTEVQLSLGPVPSEAHVHVHEGRFCQAVEALLANAAEALHGAGRVDLRCWLADKAEGQVLVGHASGPLVCVEVRDDGEGMTDETMRRAPEPFFSTRRRGKGAGLGLTRAFGMVHQYGGMLAIDSTVGQGTAVRLYLPAVSASETNAP